MLGLHLVTVIRHGQPFTITPFMVFNVTHYLELHKALKSYHRFPYLPTKINRLSGQYTICMTLLDKNLCS